MKSKAMITEKAFSLELKGQGSIVENDVSSKLFFSNHLDMKLSDAENRRFVFFRTNAKPLSKDFYSEMYTDESDIKEEYVINLINFLIQRDISGYDANSKPYELSDDKLINELRISKSHPMTQFLTLVFEKDVINMYRNKTTVLLSDLKKLIEDREECNNEEIREFMRDYNRELQSSFRNINSIIEKAGYVCKKSCYRDETRNKMIIEKICKLTY